MREMWFIALNDLRVFFRERGVIVGLVLIPLIMTVAIGLGTGSMASSGPTRIRVDVIDNDASTLSSQFLAGIREANTSLVLCPFDNDPDDFCQLGENTTLTEDQAVERLTDNTSLALIEIPAGFESQLQAGEPVSVVYRSNENAVAPSYILQAVQAVTQKMGGALVAASVGARMAEPLNLSDDDLAAFRQETYERAAALWAQNPVSVDYRLTEQTESQSVSGTQAGFGQSVPGMGSMFVMFTVFTSLFVLIRERNNWTLQRLVMMPLSRGQILGGKILMWFMAGMLQYFAVFAIGLAVGLNFGQDMMAMLLVMIAFTFCVTALSFAVSTMLKTEMQANSVSLLLALTLAPLGGSWWPLDVVPEFMRIVGHISPVAWAMDAFQLLIFENGTLVNVLPYLAVLLVLGAVFFVFSVWRFRYE
jgi:ABC-2 type transport system permease protein